MVKAGKKLEVLVLNPIAQVGLKRLPPERFEVVKESRAPDVILVRSADMHGMKFDARLKAVGRAGAGVNNIPVAALSKRGPLPSWIEVNPSHVAGKVRSWPNRDEMSYPIDEQLIVELYSK